MGWLIDESLPVPPAARARGFIVDIDMKPDELRVVRRLRSLADTATTAHDKMVIDAFAHLVVRLPAQGYGTTEFDMSDERRNALVAAGGNAMAAYLDRAPAAAPAPRGLAAAGADRSKQAADRIATRLLGL
jgi:hypothetical protein